nr:NADH dehydrogenase subunit 4L [Trichophilopterus babakotophilus]
MFYMVMIMFTVSGWKFFISSNEMSMLICLEMMMASLYMLILTISPNFGMEYFILVSWIVVSVCEAILGLALMTSLMKFTKDYSTNFKNLNLSKF